MVIFIQHLGQKAGPFTPPEIQAGLASGIYQTSDLVWCEGMKEWAPLSTSLHILQDKTTPVVALTPYNGTTSSSGLAITSMVLGISAFFLCGITALPAVICGHLALVKIKRSEGRFEGNGFAITGLITGYLGFIVLFAAMAGLMAPLVIRQRMKANQSEAINNARSFGLSLMEFKMEYGSYPNSATAPRVAETTNTPEITGTSSNARFRQLIRSGITQSEQIFYAKGDGMSKPDGDISGDNALAPGECGFAYLENVRTDDKKPRPIAMAPFQYGSSKFDTEPFNARAVILWSDNFVSSLPINLVTGSVLIDGQDLLDPTHPIWGGTPPSLLLPE